MALLALQFGLQPLFSKANVSPGADKVPLVLLCELLKMCVAFVLLVTCMQRPKTHRMYETHQ